MLCLSPVLRAIRRQWLLYRASRWQVLADTANHLSWQELANARYFEKRALLARADASQLLP